MRVFQIGNVQPDLRGSHRCRRRSGEMLRTIRFRLKWLMDWHGRTRLAERLRAI